MAADSGASQPHRYKWELGAGMDDHAYCLSWLPSCIIVHVADQCNVAGLHTFDEMFTCQQQYLRGQTS